MLVAILIEHPGIDDWDALVTKSDLLLLGAGFDVHYITNPLIHNHQHLASGDFGLRVWANGEELEHEAT